MILGGDFRQILKTKYQIFVRHWKQNSEYLSPEDESSGVVQISFSDEFDLNKCLLDIGNIGKHRNSKK